MLMADITGALEHSNRTHSLHLLLFLLELLNLGQLSVSSALQQTASVYFSLDLSIELAGRKIYLKFGLFLVLFGNR